MPLGKMAFAITAYVEIRYNLQAATCDMVDGANTRHHDPSIHFPIIDAGIGRHRICRGVLLSQVMLAALAGSILPTTPTSKSCRGNGLLV